MAAGHRGAAGGSKLTDDDIRGPEYYAGRIAAIEAADVSMIWSVAIVFFSMTPVSMDSDSCSTRLCFNFY